MEIEKKFNIGDYTIIKIVTQDFLLENCYIIKHSGCNEIVIIDPGYNMEEILKETQYNEMHIKFIILSHAHFDHLGISAELQEKFRIPCYVHINDKRMLMHADMYAQRFAGCRVKIPKEISFYDSDKLFVFGEESFSVIHTPGHSEGGVCIIFNNFIFTGDTLLFESIGRTDLPTGNMKHLSQSIKKIFELSSDHMLIFPGHGGNWSIYEAKKWWNENKHIYINNSLGFD